MPEAAHANNLRGWQVGGEYEQGARLGRCRSVIDPRDGDEEAKEGDGHRGSPGHEILREDGMHQAWSCQRQARRANGTGDVDHLHQAYAIVSSISIRG